MGRLNLKRHVGEQARTFVKKPERKSHSLFFGSQNTMIGKVDLKVDSARMYYLGTVDF